MLAKWFYFWFLEKLHVHFLQSYEFGVYRSLTRNPPRHLSVEIWLILLLRSFLLLPLAGCKAKTVSLLKNLVQSVDSFEFKSKNIFAKLSRDLFISETSKITTPIFLNSHTVVISDKIGDDLRIRISIE